MNNQDSQAVVARFFEALRRLRDNRTIRGKATFAREHGIDRRNLSKLEHDLTRDIFQPAWLTYLVRDYDISAHWLLTGHGRMITTPKQRYGR